MIARCVEAGLREPEFEATGTFVTRILRAAPAGQPVVFTDPDEVRRTRESNRTQPESRRESPGTRARTLRETNTGPTEKPAQNRQRNRRETNGERILALLRERPHLTIPDLADRLGLSVGGVRHHLERLRSAGRLRRVGPTKGGRWNVLA